MARRVLLAVAALVGAACLYVAYVVLGLPSRSEVRALARRNPGQTGVMRQREREAKKAKHAFRVRQDYVPLPLISRHLINAVLVSEDPKFFGHAGIDWEAIRESAEEDLRKGRFFRGGSTITQQLAKNLFFDTHKSISRKLREAVVARWLEDYLSKRRILELYLNVIEWGDGVFGCEAASERYFGKRAADLDPQEAAGLAAMIPSPRRINPLASPARYARAQRHILWLMEHAGYIKREVAGLGALPVEPSPEPSTDDDDSTPDGATTQAEPSQEGGP